MKNIFINFLFIFTLASLATAQSISLKMGSVNLEKIEIGDKVSVPVYCQNIEGKVGTFQMYIEYDHDVLTYQKVNITNPDIKDNLKYNNTENFWASVWISFTRQTLDIIPGSKLFELVFVYNGGESQLKFGNESILENKRIVKGETLFVTLDGTGFLLNVENGCVCNNTNK